MVAAVVKLPWNTRERRSCTSDYWHIAFLHLQIRKNAQEWQVVRYINKTQVPIEKRKANMASNIHSHQHLMGPALVAGSPW